MFTRKYFIEIVGIIFLLFIFMVFGPQVFATVDYAVPEPDWKYEMTEKIYEAYAQFEIDCYNDIDHDITDMDCALVSLKLIQEIDRILFSYRNEILDEVLYEDLEEYKLEKSQK